MEFLDPAMWHDHDIDFARWQHPAMWHVALGSWQRIHQVAVGLYPATWHVALGWHAIEFAQTSVILEFYFWFRFRPYHRSRHVTLHQSAKFYPNWTTIGRKKWCHVDFQGGGFQGSNNRLFEKPMYDFLDRSSIETIAVNCLDKDEQQWKRLNWFNSQRVRVQCRMRTAICDDNETTTLLIDVVRLPTSDLWLLRAEVVHLPSPNSSVRFVCQLRTRLSNPQPSY